MNCLVVIELRNGVAGDDALGVLSHAAALGLSPTVVAFGDLADRSQIAAHGAARLIEVAGSNAVGSLPEQRRANLLDLCLRENFDLILATATSTAGEVFAGLAAQMDGGLLWGLSALAREGEDLIGLRPVQGDAMLARHCWTANVRLGLFRPYVLPPVSCPAGDMPVQTLTPDEGPCGTRIVERSTFSSAGVSLANADIIVSAGRGIGGPENLPLVQGLADSLGGVMGASLPVIEAGWLPRSLQVGQTGTIVRPRLYVACGISGQIQHRLGMERSGKIIAINSDASAPIMSFCDLAVVGKLEKLLPELTDLVLNSRKSA